MLDSDRLLKIIDAELEMHESVARAMGQPGLVPGLKRAKHIIETQADYEFEQMGEYFYPNYDHEHYTDHAIDQRKAF